MSEPFIGQVTMFAGNFAPRSWAFCEGQLLPINSNQSLFSLLGTIYGGDGRTTFALPDLRGRTPISPGPGPGLPSNNLGQRGGAANVTLTTAQLPSHTHTVGNLRANASPADTDNPTANSLAIAPAYSVAAPTVDMHGASLGPMGNTGGGSIHPNMPPYLAINYIIALVGIYPSRN
jgi:microcystin-dependent protein